MAQRKIIWSPRSGVDLIGIMEFYERRNGNINYSRKIYARIRKSLLILKQFPGIGAKTDIENIRNLILGDFCVFLQNR